MLDDDNRAVKRRAKIPHEDPRSESSQREDDRTSFRRADREALLELCSPDREASG